MKGRFAPSPTGYIHLGNVWIALLSYLSVRKQKGAFILRMEDIDLQRSKREWGEALLFDLKWLGFEWDEGPYWQSERYPFYERILQKLEVADYIYPCYCNRSRIQNISSAPHIGEIPHLYDGHCRHLTPEEAIILSKQKEPSWRIKCEDCHIAFEDMWKGPQTFSLRANYDDFVVKRADNMFAYNLAVVLDDLAMGVTEIIRGVDLLESTANHIFLQHIVEPYVYEDMAATSCKLRISTNYGHAPLLVDEENIRLSKRQDSITIAELRDKGITASQILTFLAIKGGILSESVIESMPPGGYSLAELVEVVTYPFPLYNEYIKITKLDLTKLNYAV